MTAATMQCPSLSACTVRSSEPLFSSFSSGEQDFSLSMPAGSVSFDWSDFPVVYQYNEDMPAPAVSSSFRGPAMQYSSSPVSFRTVTATLPGAIVVDDEESTSSSVLSDEDVPLSSSLQENLLKQRTRERSIKFSELLEVRSHAVVLGDHPCSSGLALELSWEPSNVEVVNFEFFENSRQACRRHMSQLRLSYYERRRLLEKSMGLSEYELVQQQQRFWRECDGVARLQSPDDRAPTCPVKSKACALSEDKDGVLVLKKVSSTAELSALS